MDPHYRTVVSDSLEIEMPENVITQYHREPVILPEVAEIYPAPAALEWHHANVFGG